MKLNDLLARVDAWVTMALLALFYVFMVSGYMITRGFIHRYWGLLLHTRLDLPIMAAFSLHFSIRLRFFLARRRPANQLLTNALTLAVGLLSFGFIVYLDLVFQLS